MHTPVENAEEIADGSNVTYFFKVDLYDGNMYIKEKGKKVDDHQVLSGLSDGDIISFNHIMIKNKIALYLNEEKIMTYDLPESFKAVVLHPSVRCYGGGSILVKETIMTYDEDDY